jgi:hypothetical protein
VPVPSRYFLGQSADRLLLQDCDNTFKTSVLCWVKVNDVPVRSHDRVLQLLKILPHVL